jgi:hypothetical protein
MEAYSTSSTLLDVDHLKAFTTAWRRRATGRHRLPWRPLVDIDYPEGPVVDIDNPGVDKYSISTTPAAPLHSIPSFCTPVL